MALNLHLSENDEDRFKILIAANYADVQVELVPPCKLGVYDKAPAYLQFYPTGKAPFLEIPDGIVFGTDTIARYVSQLKDDNTLYASSAIEYAQVEQWIAFSTKGIYLNLLKCYNRRIGLCPYHLQAEGMIMYSLQAALEVFNTHLASKTYLVGHSVTLADIMLTCHLHFGFTRLLVKGFTSQFPHVERYFWCMVQQQNFQKILGDVKQTIALPPIKPAKKKTEYPKKEATPKPKPILLSSNTALIKWKGIYSKNRKEAAEGFWEMYNLGSYSLWFCDCNYNDENTVSFKLGRFVQHMHTVDQCAFGKMLVIGSKPSTMGKGLWLFYGQAMPEKLIDDRYDMKLYRWTKVEISDETQKVRVNQMIEASDHFEGQPVFRDMYLL